ncbi:MAG: hypothetical protein COA71_00020 [SAR86 cluster bacterium]|uniref:Uncharacterized protein n=1 Tax=SAR86 cluster bacterium TaxID=2030880 RepID=A0A2A5CHS3_9GAMM|nr:MAG: hypothetical protein COA71_00020 [SAR86 cluster bacterium]
MSDHKLPDMDVIISTLFYLMSRYSGNSDPKIAGIISQHFGYLQTHPECKSTIMKSSSEKLLLHWAKLADQKTSHAKRISYLEKTLTESKNLLRGKQGHAGLTSPDLDIFH